MGGSRAAHFFGIHIFEGCIIYLLNTYIYIHIYGWVCEVSRAARLVFVYVLKDVLHQYIYIYI